MADCFRSIYFGDTIDAAFGEVLAAFQPPLAYLAKFAAVDDEEPLTEVLAGVLHVEPQTGKVRGIVPAEWRASRRLCAMTLDSGLRFADLSTMRSRLYLRHELADIALELGLNDLDFSAILSTAHRRLTQACAAHIHELRNEQGAPRFAGIHYVSRLNIGEWRCWALFDDRIAGRNRTGVIAPIPADHEPLVRVARRYDLAIETVPGGDHYLL